jgi:dishevelled associated activator of morphogenesis
VTSEIATLTAEYNKVAQEMESVEQTSKGDKFASKMKTFVEDAKLDLEILNKKYVDTVEQFEKVATFFGEDAKKITPEEFFGLIHKFDVLMRVRTNFNFSQSYSCLISIDIPV